MTEREKALQAVAVAVLKVVPCLEVRSWPPGFRLKDDLLAAARAAIDMPEDPPGECCWGCRVAADAELAPHAVEAMIRAQAFAEGAEAMREAAAEHLYAIVVHHAKIGNTFTMPRNARGAAKQKARFFSAASKEIRALPLPGAKEGDHE